MVIFPFAFHHPEARAIPLASVRIHGRVTRPRSYGVYEIPSASSDARRYRLGTHPVRMLELERQHGTCQLLYLFLRREDAVLMADRLNASAI